MVKGDRKKVSGGVGEGGGRGVGNEEGRDSTGTLCTVEYPDAV